MIFLRCYKCGKDEEIKRDVMSKLPKPFILPTEFPRTKTVDLCNACEKILDKARKEFLDEAYKKNDEFYSKFLLGN